MARLDGESIYRRIAVRMHADEKVQRLTKPQPCGRSLWWELLAGEQTDVVPGLFRIGEAAFAEQLGWSLKGFRDAWKEVEDARLPVRADWDSRLIWVRNAIHHNMPASPKVVLHWKDCWRDRLPECALKEEARTYIEATLKAFSEPYAEAFRKVYVKALPKPSPNTSPEPSREATRYQEAVSSNQKEKEIDLSARIEGENPQAPVENFDFEGISDADKLQVLKSLKSGNGPEAIALLNSVRTGTGGGGC